MTNVEIAERQIELQGKIQSAGFNIVTCGNCGSILLHELEDEKIDCFCGNTMDLHDCPDLWHKGAELSAEFSYEQPKRRLKFTEIPANYDHINNSELRRAFEGDMVSFCLEAEGYVGNKLTDFHEDTTWAINLYCEDGIICRDSFIYSSEHEYKQDCELLGL
jgi:hypothetical protein